MVRYRVVLEIQDVDGFSEESINEAIRDGLDTLGITVIKSEPFERVGEEEVELLKELQEYAEKVEDGDIEVTFDKGTYYVLHICKNNMPVPLYQTEDINELADYVYSNY